MRTVEDAALTLNVMAGSHSLWPVQSPPLGHRLSCGGAQAN